MYLEPSKDHCGRSEREEGWEESVLVLFLTFCETVSETVSEIERLREGEGGRERGEKILEMYSMYNTHHVHECICRHMRQREGGGRILEMYICTHIYTYVYVFSW